MLQLGKHSGSPYSSPMGLYWKMLLVRWFETLYMREKGKSVLNILPISNGKTHRVPNDNDRYDSVSTKVAVRIDAVGNRYLTAHSDAGTEHIHRNDQPEPVNAVCRSNSP